MIRRKLIELLLFLGDGTLSDSNFRVLLHLVESIICCNPRIASAIFFVLLEFRQYWAVMSLELVSEQTICFSLVLTLLTACFTQHFLCHQRRSLFSADKILKLQHCKKLSPRRSEDAIFYLSSWFQMALWNLDVQHWICVGNVQINVRACHHLVWWMRPFLAR